MLFYQTSKVAGIKIYRNESEAPEQIISCSYDKVSSDVEVANIVWGQNFKKREISHQIGHLKNGQLIAFIEKGFWDQNLDEQNVCVGKLDLQKDNVVNFFFSHHIKNTVFKTHHFQVYGIKNGYPVIQYVFLSPDIKKKFLYTEVEPLIYNKTKIPDVLISNHWLDESQNKQITITKDTPDNQIEYKGSINDDGEKIGNLIMMSFQWPHTKQRVMVNYWSASKYIVKNEFLFAFSALKHKFYTIFIDINHHAD